MITKKDKLTVAVFVLATVAILVISLGTLWGLRATRPLKRYTIVTTSSVSGLNKSANVNYLGVNVGKVESMQFAPGEVQLTIAVEMDTPVVKGTKAQLTAQGITGIQIIELIPGPSSNEALPPGGHIEFVPSSLQEIVGFFSENKTKVSETIGNANAFILAATAAIVSGQTSIERVASRVEALLDEDRAAIRQVLDRSNALVTDLQKAVQRLDERHFADELADTVATTKKTIGDIDRAVSTLNQQQQLGQSALGDAIADLRSTARSAAEAATAARAVIDRLGPPAQDDLEAVRGTLDQVQRTVRSLEELSRELKGRPSLLVRDLAQPRRDIPDK